MFLICLIEQSTSRLDMNDRYIKQRRNFWRLRIVEQHYALVVDKHLKLSSAGSTEDFTRSSTSSRSDY